MVTGQSSGKKVNIAFVMGHLSHGGAEKQLFLLSKGIDKSKFNPVGPLRDSFSFKLHL